MRHGLSPTYSPEKIKLLLFSVRSIDILEKRRLVIAQRRKSTVDPLEVQCRTSDDDPLRLKTSRGGPVLMTYEAVSLVTSAVVPQRRTNTVDHIDKDM
jgi:hypothetical protein